MDPNLFHLDWDRVAEVLTAIVVLSLIIERALSVLFESKFWTSRLKDKGFKEWVAFIVSVAVCIYWDFDAVSMIFLKESVTIYGMVITGGIIAGGSKGSIKLFRDVLGFMSNSERDRLKKLGLIDDQKPGTKGGDGK